VQDDGLQSGAVEYAQIQEKIINADDVSYLSCSNGLIILMGVFGLSGLNFYYSYAIQVLERLFTS
jgi:hypothetical protein